jgi:hypothetical protein
MDRAEAPLTSWRTFFAELTEAAAVRCNPKSVTAPRTVLARILGVLCG